MNQEMRVTPIRNGTVIDHLPAGTVLKIARILGVPGGSSSVVSILMNVPSQKQTSGLKDILKIEDRELSSRDLACIALVDPGATISIIRNYSVDHKVKLEKVDELVEVIRCTNPACISNRDGEPIIRKSRVVDWDPPRVSCHYCGREQKDVFDSLI